MARRPLTGSKLTPMWRRIYISAREQLRLAGYYYPYDACSWTLKQRADYREKLNDRIDKRLAS